MRNKLFVITGLLMIAGLAIVACTNTAAKEETAAATPDSAQMVKRGEYLVNAIGCDDCHSPKRMGPHGPEIIPELRLSGFPHDGQIPPVNVNEVKKGWAMFAPDLTTAVGPWGQSYAANLTSDPTGAGSWPEENFIRALRHGKSKGIEANRDLLPPMPWFVYKNMTDDDLRAIFAFLRTTKPVNNIPPAPRTLDEIK